jgi:sugar/nucleoside kinase (ribokinase family)
MIDVVALADEVDAEWAIIQKHVYAPIKILAGGTALVSAQAAVKSGFGTTVVLAAVGADVDGRPDAAAGQIESELRSIGVSARLKLISGSTTGTVMISHFNGDRRLLIANPGANLHLTKQMIDKEDRLAICDCDIVLFSGYFLLDNNRTEIILSLMLECKSAGVLIALDLVPHGLETRTDSLDQCLAMTDAIVSEAGTAFRIWAPGSESRTASDIETLASEMNEGRSFVLLRADNDREYLVTTTAGRWLDTGYAIQSPDLRRGYLDKRAVEHLYDWIKEVAAPVDESISGSPQQLATRRR